jgi:hypothetical protein
MDMKKKAKTIIKRDAKEGTFIKVHARKPSKRKRIDEAVKRAASVYAETFRLLSK